MTPPRPGDPVWARHIAASISEGFCPRHGVKDLYDDGDGWWYCLLLDTYWSMGGREETAEVRWARAQPAS